jgi:hypothetical protein
VLEAAIKNLFAVAKTGVHNILWPSEDVGQLAQLIASLVAENEQMRRWLGLRELRQPAVSYDGQFVRLSFGPGGAYTLQIPAHDESQRKALADELAGVVTELRRSPTTSPVNPNQLPLPFNN